MPKQKTVLETIKEEFQEVVNLLETHFGKGYAAKNPNLVEHLMDKIHQEKDQRLKERLSM